MSEQPKARYVLTTPGVLTFRHLAKAEPVAKGGKEKFDVNIEFEPSSADVAAMKSLIMQVAQNGRPGVNRADIDVPLKDGNVLADTAERNAVKKGKEAGSDPRKFSRGKQVLIARSDYRPSLGYLEGGRLVELADDPSLIAARERDTFYPGVEVLGEVEFAWHDEIAGGRPGVNAYINQVLSLKRGERVMGGGRPSMAETFKGYAGIASTESVTGGAEGEAW